MTNCFCAHSSVILVFFFPRCLSQLVGIETVRHWSTHIFLHISNWHYAFIFLVFCKCCCCKYRQYRDLIYIEMTYWWLLCAQTVFFTSLSSINCCLSVSTGVDLKHSKFKFVTETVNYLSSLTWYHEPLTRYVKLRVAHAPGMPGTFSPPPT